MAEAPKTVLSFGEVLWDLMPDGSRLGGAPFNLAYRLSSLGDRALPVSRLGTDVLGRRAYEQALSLGVEVSRLQWDAEHATGIVRVTFDGDGSPDYTIVPDVAYDHIELTPAILKLAAECDSICFGTVAQRGEIPRETCRALLQAAPKAVKLLDLNLRKECWSRETVLESLEIADIVKLNETEAMEVGRLVGASQSDVVELAVQLLERFRLDCCVVTLGERGCAAISSSGESARVAGFPIEFSDALGAGDAFTAGFLHRHLRGASLFDSCAHGNAMGALAASRPGATAPISRDEVTALVSSMCRQASASGAS